MSGIGGIRRLDGGPVSTADLTGLAADMARRGPDAWGSWREGAVGLVHRLLRTGPAARSAKLPWTAGHLTITADARIDNRDDLIRTLGPECRSPRGISDAELILAAYAAWGVRCVERLLGDFAFVIFDARRRVLFGARDHFGTRPLYYYESEALFAFASDAEALRRVPGLRLSVNEARIADYLVPALEGVDRTSTFFREIRRLPPGHRFELGERGMTVRAYWRPEPASRIQRGSDSDVVEAFLSLFEEAVACRLRDVPRAASMLSGGLDSSSIVAVASTLLARRGRELRTYSAVSGNGVACGESRAIAAVQRLPGLRPVSLGPSAIEDPRTDLGALTESVVEPFDAHMILPRLIYVAARREGVSTVLDGVDGDYVTSLEPGFLAALLRRGHWWTAVHEALGLARFYRGFYAPWESAPRLLWVHARRAFSPAPFRRFWRAARRNRRGREAIAGTILHADLARRADVTGRLELLWQHDAVELSADLSAWQARQLEHPYLVAALERYDRVAAFHSVEPRHPFIDRRLVEFCLALPWRQKVRHGWSKAVVRRAMAGYLPDEVRWRRGRWERLGPLFTTRFLEAERGRLDRFVRRDLHRLDGYVDVAAVESAHVEFLQRGDAAAGEQVWQAANLASWLARHAGVRRSAA